MSSNWYQEAVDNWMLLNAAPDVKTGEARMIWADLETTGLDPQRDLLLEVTIFVTDEYGFVLGSYNTFVIDDIYVSASGVHLGTPTRSKSNEFVQKMHDKSSLWADIDLEIAEGRRHHWSVDQAQEALIEWLSGYFPEGSDKLPLSGSSVDFDRSWLNEYMPDLMSQFFTHRVIDVSSNNEQIKLLNPELIDIQAAQYESIGAHRGEPDLIDSIELYRFQIAEFFWTKENAESVVQPTNFPRGIGDPA